MDKEKEYIVTPPEIPNLLKTRTQETPKRIQAIRTALEGKRGLVFEKPQQADTEQAKKLIRKVHRSEMVTLIEIYSRTLKHQVALFDERLLPPPEVEGYETPLYREVYTEALLSAASAIKAANLLINDTETAFAFSLGRPPGHHAAKGKIGGFCYFNNVALVAEKLSQEKKRVAILDIDFHHGNGTQEIFWDKDILFVSLHGHPKLTYPYSGFPEEKGQGKGEGKTYNLPFPIGIKPQKYLEFLKMGFNKIDDYNPDVLVVSAGFDTHELDPVAKESAGGFGPTELWEEDFGLVGETIGNFQKPTVLVLEGGYNLEVLGNSVANFIDGLHLALTHR